MHHFGLVVLVVDIEHPGPGHIAQGDGGDNEAGPLRHRLQHRLRGDVDVPLTLHRQVVAYPLFQDKVRQEILANCQIDFYYPRPRE